MKDYIRWPLVLAAVVIIVLLFHMAKSLDLHTVIKVYDGDTIQIEDGTRVRLIGIDAPEVNSPYGHAEPYGYASKRYLVRLLHGEKVRIKVGPEPFDKYGRTLAYIYLTDGTLVNARIVRDGWARVYRRFGFRYKDLFVSYEREARAKGIGMWQGKK